MKSKEKKFGPKILWIGPFIPPNYMREWLAASPAANKWQKHIVEALVDEGADVEWLYYRPDPYWPRGRLLPSKENIPSKIVHKQNHIHYFNTIALRNFTLKKSLQKILKKKIEDNGSQRLIIISYNSSPWVNKIFSDKNIRSKFSCVYIIADKEVLPGADGYVFLSYDSFKKYNKNCNKLHLDGAVYPLLPIQNVKKINKKKNKTIFLYSGSFDKWGGVLMLLDAMDHIKDDKFELWVCGPANDKLFKSAVKKDQRIKYLGLLTDNQLQNTYKKADIFLNPRPVNMPGNEINFPSKLFDYLAWNKPIISTWTKSLSPIYKKVLHVVNDNPVAIASAMKSFLEVKKYSKIKNKKWIEDKNWNNEANKLKNFLRKIITRKIFV